MAKPASTPEQALAAALDEAAVKVKDIMTKNGFYQGKDPMNFAATAPGMWVGRGKPLPF